MGNIADRLARKNDPLYAPAKAIIKAAAAYVESGEDDDAYEELAEAIEAAVEGRIGAELGELLQLVEVQAEPRQDSEELLDAVQDVLEPLCEVLAVDPHTTGYLVATPILFEDCPTSWGVSVPDEKFAEITRILKTTGLVEEDAEVYFLPRVVSSLEADMLEYGDIRKILTCMSQGLAEEALAAVALSNARVAMALPEPVGGVGPDPFKGYMSTGLLVAFIASKDTEAFPLAMELSHEMALATTFADADDQDELDDFGDDLPPAIDEALFAQAREDVHAVLALAAEPLALALAVPRLTVLYPPRDWFTGVDCARSFERNLGATEAVRAIAAAQACGVVEALCVDDDFDSELGDDLCIDIALHLKADGTPVGVLKWRPMTRETPDECFDAMTGFLASMGLGALSEGPSTNEAKGASPHYGGGTTHTLH